MSTPATLNSIITYVRRIVKTPSDQALATDTIIDYINRFYTYDVPERLQLFELKTKFNLETTPLIDRYNMPFNTIAGVQNNLFYQGIEPPVYIDGLQINMTMSRDQYFKVYPRYLFNQEWDIGDGTVGAYTITLGNSPIQRGHTPILGIDPALGATNPAAINPSYTDPGVFVSAFDSSGNRMILQDDGLGNLVTYPLSAVNPAGSGSVDYFNGIITVTFANSVPGTLNNQPNPIETQVWPFVPGKPQYCLFYNNVIQLRPVPDRTYLFEADAYLTPAAFLETTDAVQFGYMAEYLARGAARKLLSDVGDYDQFQFYEQFFREQENLVLRRTERQTSIERVPTIYTQTQNQRSFNYNQQGS